MSDDIQSYWNRLGRISSDDIRELNESMAVPMPSDEIMKYMGKEHPVKEEDDTAIVDAARKALTEAVFTGMGNNPTWKRAAEQAWEEKNGNLFIEKVMDAAHRIYTSHGPRSV